MNIDEIPAGRELDALVAEKVMGIQFPVEIFNEGRTLEMVRTVPLNYSTDIAAAWQVETSAREHSEEQYILALAEIINQEEDAGINIFSFDMSTDACTNMYEALWFFVHASPVQRCRAALKAVME